MLLREFCYRILRRRIRDGDGDVMIGQDDCGLWNKAIRASDVVERNKAIWADGKLPDGQIVCQTGKEELVKYL